MKQKYVLLDNPHAVAARDAPCAGASIAPLGRRSTAHGAADAPLPVQRAPAASAREVRRLGLHAIPPEAQRCAERRAMRHLRAWFDALRCRFELYTALHSLWERHAASVLEAGASREAALAGVDLHGAMVKVVRASCPQRVGLEGICLKHTAEVLFLLSPYNVLHGASLAAAPAPWLRAHAEPTRSGAEARLRVCLCSRRMGVPRRGQRAGGPASAAGGQAQR